MTAVSVWIKLYMSKDDQNPSVFKIKDFTGDVDDLKEKIKEKKTNDLKDIDADRLEVYPQGTDVPNLGGIAEMDPGKEVPIGTTSTNPLIVLPNEQWLQQQEPQKRGRVSVITMEVSIDDVSEGILEQLRNGRVGGVRIELQGHAQAALLHLKQNRLKLPILPDDETRLMDRLAQESMNLTSFAAKSNIELTQTTATNRVPTGLWKFLSYVELNSFSFTGETEDEIHSFVEAAITGPIRKFFGNTFRISRNKATKTSSGRADYSISSDYLQLFRGEDKMRSRIAQDDPSTMEVRPDRSSLIQRVQETRSKCLVVHQPGWTGPA